MTDIDRSHEPDRLPTKSSEGFERVYIAHPLRGATPEATEANRSRASFLTARLSAAYRVAPEPEADAPA